MVELVYGRLNDLTCQNAQDSLPALPALTPAGSKRGRRSQTSYEVRTKVDRIQYRVLFCIAGATMVLLHGFVKKARTEPDDIALGRRRQRQIAQEDIP
jgi:phage-related protein